MKLQKPQVELLMSLQLIVASWGFKRSVGSMVILSLTGSKRLVSQEQTATTGWVTDASTTYSWFMGIVEKCWLNCYPITYSSQEIGQPRNYSNHRLEY